MTTKDYSVIAGNIVEKVGGKDNIMLFTHCLTRLRFNLKDKGLVDEEAISKMPGVTGIRWAADQIQIIIGQDVADVYKLVCKTNGLKREAAIDENLDGAEMVHKKLTVSSVLLTLSGCIVPLLPMLIGGGMIKAAILCLSTFGLMSADSATYAT